MFVRLMPVIALAGALLTPLGAGAQTTAASPNPAASTAPAMQGAPMQHHHRHTSLWHALRSVDLTPAQQQQIKTIHDQAKTANANADAATKQANAAKTRAAVMAVLTPEQRTQVTAAMHASRSHQMTTTGSGAAPMASPTP